MGSAGPSLWFVGGGGGCSLLFMVVGTQCVFVVLVYHLRVLDLPWSFLSQHDMAADRWGRGDVEGAVLVGWVVIDMVGLLTYPL